MASGKTSKAVRSARASVVVKKPTPWGTIAAIVAVVVFAGGVFGYTYYKWDVKQSKERELAAFTPSADNPDPSDKIEGVEKVDYSQARGHVTAVQQVAYDKFPPFGGAHDGVWADCSGRVYASPVRNENMVHGLEHGAVWIAYNPDQVTGEALESLKDRVEGQPFTMLSPYPDLDRPISLQSWGHQLKLDSASDARIDQFIRALRINENTFPEAGATCDADPGTFSVDSPPPFVAKPGPDALPLTYTAPEEQTGQPSSAPPTGASGAPATSQAVPTTG
jgi:hypothetical protein